MSLLMEALRKAEEAKRRMQQEELAAAAGKDPRAAAEPANTGSQQRPEAAFTLEEREPAVTPQYIRDNFTTPPEPAPLEPSEDAPVRPEPEPEPEPAYVPPAESPSSARNLARRQQRAAAASVFAAKQNPARNRKTLTVLVIVMVLMIPVGGGVLWYLQSATVSSIGVNPAIANYDLSARSSLSDAQPAAPAAATTATATSPPSATTTAPAIEPVPVASDTATANAAETANATTQAPAEATADAGAIPAPAAPNAVAESPAAPPPEPATETALAAPPPAPVPGGAPAPAATNGLELPESAPTTMLAISRTRGTTQVNPELAAAYARLQAGDLLVAGQLYQEVLDTLPNNRDALLGLASVHMRQGQVAAARELYARLLQLNPRDALAHTGMLQTVQAIDAVEHETALKRLMAQYPNVAQLTLALGNLYASQQRWSEAQAAYYNALLAASRGSNGAVHPDYAFNLAVSLEQLNQPKAALDYYRQAQALAADVTPGFDPQLLNSRLAYLEQAQP